MSSKPVIRISARNHGDDQVLDRVDAEDLECVELLADFSGTEVGGDRAARCPEHDDGGDERGELSNRGEDEEATKPVKRAEQLQKATGLEAGRPEADGDHRTRRGNQHTCRARRNSSSTPPRRGREAGPPRRSS